MIEVDVLLGHDDTLSRMTNCTGTIEGKTWATVSRCKIDQTGTPLNLLEELFRDAPDNRVFLIEPKAQADATKLTLALAEKRKVWAAIRKYDVADRVIIASFSIDAIKSLKASRPPAGVRYALNDSGSLVSPSKVKSVAGFYVVKWDLVTRSQVAAYRDAGLYVCLHTPNKQRRPAGRSQALRKRHHHR
jgi:glycerophosphoryl diester phosphodiesterase